MLKLIYDCEKISYLALLNIENTVDYISAGSTKTNGSEPKSCLGRVFNIKLGCFCSELFHNVTY